MSKVSNITIENARIAFRNFSGSEQKFNPAGRRNFCVILDFDIAERLKADGWNIKYLKPREEGDVEQPYIQVEVSFDPFPPKITMISSKGHTVLDEVSVNSLDWAEITNVDLIIRPYEWDINGKQGIKAYAKTMYVKIFEDELEKKYSHEANCVGPHCEV